MREHHKSKFLKELLRSGSRNYMKHIFETQMIFFKHENALPQKAEWLSASHYNGGVNQLRESTSPINLSNTYLLVCQKHHLFDLSCTLNRRPMKKLVMLLLWPNLYVCLCVCQFGRGTQWPYAMPYTQQQELSLRKPTTLSDVHLD